MTSWNTAVHGTHSVTEALGVSYTISTANPVLACGCAHFADAAPHAADCGSSLL
jgi:hypothetical protein